MRKLLFLLLVFLPFSINANIVNNSGSTPADSISIPFYALDSTGDVVTLTTGDYVILTVFYPSGAEAYQDSIAYNDAKITSSAIDAAGYNATVYSYKAPVANIDGTPVQGLYSYLLLVVDESSAALGTPHKGQFNLLTETDFNTSIEYIKDVLDTVQNQDNWVAKEASLSLLATAAELVKAIDSINAILDTVQLYDTRLALETSVSAIRDSVQYLVTAVGFSTFNASLDSILVDMSAFNSALDNDTTLVVFLRAAIDKLVSILDSLQAQDNWVAKEASLFDPNSDSVLIANRSQIAAQGADSTYDKFNEDTNENAFKADVSALALESSLGDVPTNVWNILFSTAFTAGSMGDSTKVNHNRNILLTDISQAGNVYRTIAKTASDVDTLFYLHTNDTTMAKIYFHTGGVAGGPPDSTRVITSGW